MKTSPKLTFFVIAVSYVVYAISGPLVAQETTSAPTSEKPAETTSVEGKDAETNKEDAEKPKDGKRVAPAVNDDAVSAIERSRDAIKKLRSISANVRETVAIGGKKVRATGRYVQGTEGKLRVEFQIHLGSKEDGLTGTLLQVSDGKILWTQRRIGDTEKDSPKVTRRDVEKIRTAAAAANPQISDSVLLAELGLGGLPALLSSIENSMTLHAIRDEKIQNKTFTVVEGTWKNAIYARFQQAARQGSDRLPEHIPDSVLIYLDPEHELFPRRIEYRKRHPTKDFSRPQVTVDFVDIVLDGPVKEEEFAYAAPEGIVIEDLTKAYLDRIDVGSANALSGGADPGGVSAVQGGLNPGGAP